MASDMFPKSCLLCSQVVLPNNNAYLGKFDTLFLLKILLEIPQDSQLMGQYQSSLNCLPICLPCGITVRQCKEVYNQISEQVQRFWGFQNEILRNVHKKIENRPGHKSNQYWEELCRQYVRNRNVQAYKYPFAFHDLAELLNAPLETNQLANSFAVISDDAEIECPIEPTNKIVPTLPEEMVPIALNQFRDPLEIDNEDLNDDDDNQNDISDQYESSEEEGNVPQQFYWSYATRQFHCSFPSCSTSSKIKTFVERHYRKEHSRTLPGRTPKPTYICSWPSCGKIFKKKVSHECHMSKHNGTPSLKCKTCGKLFYYKRGLHLHQNRHTCKPIHEQTSTFNIINHYSKSATLVQNVVPNRDSSELYHATAKTQNNQLIKSTEVTCTLTSTSQQSNHYENSSLNQSNSFIGLPSSSGNSDAYSSTIEISQPFIAESEKILLKEEPQFEYEDDKYISNESDEDVDLSEDDDEDEKRMDDQPKEQQATTSNSNDAFNDLDSYTCSWPGCGKHFRDEKSLSCHMDRHRGTPKQKCEQCSELFYSVSELSNHQKTQHMKRNAKEVKMSLACTWPNCGRILSNKTSLQSHMDQHRGTPQWKCEHCQYQSYWKRDLIRHVKAVHGVNIPKMKRGRKKEKPKFSKDPITGRYKCLDSSCSKSYEDFRSVPRHNKEAHSKKEEDKNRFVCEFEECKGRTFSKRDVAESHMAKHRGIPQYKCEDCNLLFYWKCSLLVHRRKESHKILAK